MASAYDSDSDDLDLPAEPSFLGDGLQYRSLWVLGYNWNWRAVFGQGENPLARLFLYMETCAALNAAFWLRRRDRARNAIPSLLEEYYDKF